MQVWYACLWYMRTSTHVHVHMGYTVLHVFHAVGILKVKGNNKYLCIFVELSYCMHYYIVLYTYKLYMSEVHVVCA